jgi:hypothetical protein
MRKYSLQLGWRRKITQSLKGGSTSSSFRNQSTFFFMVSEEKKHKYNDVQIMEVTGFAIDQPMLHM